MKLSIVAAILLATTAADATPQEDLAFAVQNATHDKHTGWIVERLVTVQVSDKCFANLLDKKTQGVTLFTSYARQIQRYAKEISGDDWSSIENQSSNSRDANRKIVDKMVDDFKPKFHITVKLEGDDCDATGKALWLKYIGNTLTALNKYPPKSGKMNVTIDVTSKQKGVTAEVDKTGTSIAIKGSRDIEAGGWADTIEKALLRVSTKN